MPTTWQAVGPRKPTSWSGSPSRPVPSRGSGKSSPCSGVVDGGFSPELLPPGPTDADPLFGADGKRVRSPGQRGAPRGSPGHGRVPRPAVRRPAPHPIGTRPAGRRARPVSPARSARLGAAEVLRRDGVEELAELLHL